MLYYVLFKKRKVGLVKWFLILAAKLINMGLIPSSHMVDRAKIHNLSSD